MDKIKAITKTIQNKRIKLGLTQEALAEALGVSPMTIQYIEQNRRTPSLPMLLNICKYLGLKIEIK